MSSTYHQHTLKRHILSCINCFSSIPEFTVPDPTMDPRLAHAFYDTLEELVRQYGFPFNDPAQLRYLKGNFPGFHGITQPDFLDFLNKSKTNLQRNASRFQLGMRIIYVILDTHIENITIDELQLINRSLEPFYCLYAHPELFIPGLHFIPDRQPAFS